MPFTTIDRIHLKRDLFLTVDKFYSFTSAMLTFVYENTTKEQQDTSIFDFKQDQLRTVLNKYIEDLEFKNLAAVTDLCSVFTGMLQTNSQKEEFEKFIKKNKKEIEFKNSMIKNFQNPERFVTLANNIHSFADEIWKVARDFRGENNPENSDQEEQKSQKKQGSLLASSINDRRNLNFQGLYDLQAPEGDRKSCLLNPAADKIEDPDETNRNSNRNAKAHSSINPPIQPIFTSLPMEHTLNSLNKLDFKLQDGNKIEKMILGKGLDLGDASSFSKQAFLIQKSINQGRNQRQQMVNQICNQEIMMQEKLKRKRSEALKKFMDKNSTSKDNCMDIEDSSKGNIVLRGNAPRKEKHQYFHYIFCFSTLFTSCLHLPFASSNFLTETLVSEICSKHLNENRSSSLQNSRSKPQNFNKMLQKITKNTKSLKSNIVDLANSNQNTPNGKASTNSSRSFFQLYQNSRKSRKKNLVFKDSEETHSKPQSRLNKPKNESKILENFKNQGKNVKSKRKILPGLPSAGDSEIREESITKQSLCLKSPEPSHQSKHIPSKNSHNLKDIESHQQSPSISSYNSQNKSNHESSQKYRLRKEMKRIKDQELNLLAEKRNRKGRVSQTDSEELDIEYNIKDLKKTRNDVWMHFTTSEFEFSMPQNLGKYCITFF